MAVADYMYATVIASLCVPVWVAFSFLKRCLTNLTSLVPFRVLEVSHKIRGSRIPSTYEDWLAREREIDQLRGVDRWASLAESREYGFQSLREFMRELGESQNNDDYHHVCSRLRAQLDRNICMILSPKLYQRSWIQTKRLIHDYVAFVKACVWYVAMWEGKPANEWSEPTVVLQEVKDLVFGRTSIVLTGGGIITACHIGVVKTLLDQQLLPRIIVGLGTGSLVAAVVGANTDLQLQQLLKLEEVKLEALIATKENKPTKGWLSSMWRPFQRVIAHLQRPFTMLHSSVVEKFAKDNLGDLTFDEAHERTGKILNIVTALPVLVGTPHVLNYITTPHVLIRSAVVASVETALSTYAQTRLLYKALDGTTKEFQSSSGSRKAAVTGYLDKPKPPLQRVSELFHVNHFVISQTQPYIFPFLWAQMATVEFPVLGKLVRVGQREMLHWLKMPASSILLPEFIRRAAMDDLAPTSLGAVGKLYIIPEVGIRDIFGMLERPSVHALKQWSRIGEQSTWPFLLQLEVRCGIEFEMERAFDSLSRKKDRESEEADDHQS